MENADVHYGYKYKPSNWKPKQGASLFWVILVILKEEVGVARI